MYKKKLLLPLLADLIPETSELFLGLTSTQRAGMGPSPLANFVTLGYVEFRVMS